MKYNLLLIDTVSSKDQVRPAIREIYFKRLSDRGYQVTYLGRMSRKLYHDFQTKWFGIDVYLRPTLRVGRNILDLFLPISIYRLCRNKNFNVIVARNDLLSGFFAWLFSIRYRIPFVFISAFPSEELRILALERGDLRFGIIRIRALQLKKKLKIALIKQSKLVFSKSDHFSDSLNNKGIPRKNISTIPMGYNSTSFVKTEDRNKIFHNYKLSSAGTVLYFGSMDPYRNLQFLLTSFSILLKQMPKANLIMLGGTNNEIRELQRSDNYKRNAANIIFPGKVNFTAVPQFIAASDVCVSPIPPNPVYIVSSPTKVVESLGMGTPVVANKEIPDQRKIVLESGGGYCPLYNPMDFSESLVSILRDPVAARTMGKNGRAYILQCRDYNILTDNVSIALKDTINGRL